MLRIASGQYKRTPLQTPPEDVTRPTATRVRQSIFNVLLNGGWFSREEFTQINVLDAFAGSGALGLEALSLGASKAIFFEQNSKAFSCLKANCSVAKPDSAYLYKNSVLLPPERPKNIEAPQLIFLDPPYGKQLAGSSLIALQKSDWIKNNPVVVLEVGNVSELTELSEHFSSLAYEFTYQKQFGAALISIWRPFSL